MEWLNFHHLRYFWTVARKGGVRKAADELHVSQPSISSQLRLLEDSLGEKLFKRSGRSLVLTEMGHLVLTYADEIFSAGRELMNAVKQRPGGRLLRLNVGMTDSISKLMGFEFLKPALSFSEPVHVVCRMAAIEVLVNQLQAHRLDIVLADEPASSSLKAKFGSLSSASSFFFAVSRSSGLRSRMAVCCGSKNLSSCMLRLGRSGK